MTYETMLSLVRQAAGKHNVDWIIQKLGQDSPAIRAMVKSHLQAAEAGKL